MLIEAIAILMRAGRAVTATIVGEGADRAQLAELARARGLAHVIRFVGPKPARLAFTWSFPRARNRCRILCSRGPQRAFP